MKDCSQNLGPRLRHLSNRITQYMDQQFLALDLTSTQSFILHHLVLHGGCSLMFRLLVFRAVVSLSNIRNCSHLHILSQVGTRFVLIQILIPP